MKPHEIQIGTRVIYWGIIKDNGDKLDPKETEIVSEYWVLGHGEVVCKVAGISGGVSIRHLEVIKQLNP